MTILWGVELYMDSVSFRAFKRGQLSWFNSEKKINEFMLEKVKFYETDLFIDVGACFGMHAFNIKKKYPNIFVAAFEPNKFLVSLLKRSKKKNKLDIEIFNYGLGDKNMFTELNLNYLAVGFSSVYKVENYLNVKLPIEIKKIDYFNFEENYKNIGIKVDIEGFESNFLRGSKQTLNNVKWIIIELDNHKLSFAESSIKDCLKILYDSGFQVKKLKYDQYTKVRLVDVDLDSNECSEYFAFK
ncbi:FkbM family methyltransferase [Flavobacteriaceae bacterium]|nr:FkbM family methyltransferase [Flavobacteriaceae bacterium]